MKPKHLLFIIIPLLIFLFSFKLLIFNYGFYEKQFDNNLDREFVKGNVLNLFDYFKDKGELNDNFNEREKLHLEDVKNLINKANILFYILLIMFIISIIYFIYTKDFKAIRFNLIAGGCLTLLFILILVLFDFSDLFLKFHYLIFNNNLWMLNPETDLLINIFTENFFFKFFKRILLNSSIISCILIFIGILMKNVHLQH